MEIAFSVITNKGNKEIDQCRNKLLLKKDISLLEKGCPNKTISQLNTSVKRKTTDKANDQVSQLKQEILNKVGARLQKKLEKTLNSL